MRALFVKRSLHHLGLLSLTFLLSVVPVCPVRLLWCVERVNGVIIATVRSSDRVINTLPTPVHIRFRRAFVHEAVEVTLSPGQVWSAPVTVEESFNLSVRPVQGSAAKPSLAYSWATAHPSPSVLTIHTASREVGEVDAVSKPGSTSSISTSSARPWAVGAKAAFVRGVPGGRVHGTSGGGGLIGVPGGGSGGGSGSSSGSGSVGGGPMTFDISIFAPAQLVNALPVAMRVQVRIPGPGTSSGSLSARDTREGDVDDYTLEPAGVLPIHIHASSRPEVRALCGTLRDSDVSGKSTVAVAAVLCKQPVNVFSRSYRAGGPAVLSCAVFCKGVLHALDVSVVICRCTISTGSKSSRSSGVIGGSCSRTTSRATDRRARSRRLATCVRRRRRRIPVTRLSRSRVRS